MSDFRTVALALRDYIGDSYAILNAADAVLRVLPARTDMVTVERFTPDALDLAGFRSQEVIDGIRDGKLISAIKAHRAITSAGLKESKESCERVRDALARSGIVPPRTVY